MKKLLVSLGLIAVTTTSLIANDTIFNSAELIPSEMQGDGWKRIPDVALIVETLNGLAKEVKP